MAAEVLDADRSMTKNYRSNVVVDRSLRDLADLQNSESGGYANWGDNYLEEHAPYYRGIVSLVDEYIDGPILELGSAPYHVTYLLESTGYEVVATDLDPARMDSISSSAEFDVVAADIEHEPLPFKTDSVSGVLLTEVLEHLRINPLKTLQETRRVLKPDGRLLLTTPNVLSIYNLESLVTTGVIVDPYEQFTKLETVGHMGHVREYTLQEVRSLLENTGFSVKHSETKNWPGGTWRDRTLKHNLGLAVATAIPMLRKFQVHVATPAMDA